MLVESTLRDQMLAAVPRLRAFALSFAGNRDRADDLVQDTLMRGWANIDRFERGTNLEAWLFTILRNQSHSEFRKRKHEVEDVDGFYAARLKTCPHQQAHLDYEGFRTALARPARGVASGRSRGHVLRGSSPGDGRCPGYRQEPGEPRPEQAGRTA